MESGSSSTTTTRVETQKNRCANKRFFVALQIREGGGGAYPAIADSLPSFGFTVRPDSPVSHLLSLSGINVSRVLAIQSASALLKISSTSVSFRSSARYHSVNFMFMCGLVSGTS